jgi:amidase
MTRVNETAMQATESALARIEQIDPLIESVCTVNPDALAVAERLDRERVEGHVRGPLHGRPLLVKDNVDTADLVTTAGSLALLEHPPATDAPVVRAIRDAGLVLVGKANLSEWANIRDPASTSGWSAYGGLTRNPYGLNRSAGGSSSGSGAAVGAGIVNLAVGTETDGSIVCPAALCGCVGLKPTVGLVPTSGIVPVSHSQDTVGPITSTVAEAAALLTVLASVGDRDSSPRGSRGLDYASQAVHPSVSGKRIGVPRKAFWGYSAGADDVAERAVQTLADAGATIVDETNLPAELEEAGDAELIVLLAELRAGLETYLAARPDGAPRSLSDVVEFNRAHRDLELRYFGQGFFERALGGPSVDSREYRDARARCVRLARTEGIDAVLAEHRLDALVSPTYAPAWPIDLVNAEHSPGGCTAPAAMAGYPLLSVPAGVVGGLPVAVCFWGAAWSEATLIEVGAAFEQLRDDDVGPLDPPTYPSFV